MKTNFQFSKFFLALCFSILFFNSFILFAFASTLVQYDGSKDINDTLSNQTYVTQTFTIPDDGFIYDVDAVSSYLRRGSDQTSTFRYEILDTSNTILATSTTFGNAGLSTTVCADKKYSVPTTTLAAGTYKIRWIRMTGSLTSHQLRICVDNTSPSYSGGVYWIDSAHDANFTVYGATSTVPAEVLTDVVPVPYNEDMPQLLSSTCVDGVCEFVYATTTQSYLTVGNLFLLFLLFGLTLVFGIALTYRLL